MPYAMSERVLCNRIAKSLGVLDYLRNELRNKYEGGASFPSLGSSFTDMLYSGERSCLERFTNLKVHIDKNKNHYVVIDGKTIVAKGEK